MAAFGFVLMFVGVVLGNCCLFAASNRLDRALPMRPSKQLQLLAEFAAKDLGAEPSVWQAVAVYRHYLFLSLILGFGLFVFSSIR